MKAIIKTKPGPGNISVAELPLPHPKPGEALIQVTSAGICGTDLALLGWKESVVGQYNSQFPFVLGHEIAGIIVQPSDHPHAIPEGSLVAINPQLTCKQCQFCIAGFQTSCINRIFLGGTIDGGLAEYIAVPEENLYTLGDSLPAEDAAIFEPLAVATHAVLERVPPRLGDNLIVFGCGPIGLLTLILARHAGARRVFITGLERDQFRLSLAEKLGGTPINVSHEDLLGKVFEFSPNGIDVLYETSGSSVTLDSAIQLMKPRGRIGLVGLAASSTEFNSAELVIREIELIGSRGYNSVTFLKAKQMLEKVSADIRQIITHRMRLEDYEEAFELLTGEYNVASKVLFVPKL